MKDLIKVLILIGLLVIAALQACSDSVAEEVSPGRFAAETKLNDDFYRVWANGTVLLNMLANDAKLPNSTLVFGQPGHGSIRIDLAGGFMYMTEKDCKGKDTFSYRLCMDRSCENAWVKIVVY